MRTSSLFVGRWQPFHEGHRQLVEEVLKRGKPIVIAIRDTEVDHHNPYSVAERWSAIQEALASWGSLVKIVVIPDIDEICYGRDVGYDIRRIRLASDIEEGYSGTKLRKESGILKPIIWLTGQSGSGKSTLAKALQEKLGGVILDGDELRASVSVGLGFSPEDREVHNIRTARLAKVLSKQSLVIVSVIAPFEAARKKIDEIARPVWIYVERALPADPEKPYEIPTWFDAKVSPDTQPLEEEVAVVCGILKEKYGV